MLLAGIGLGLVVGLLLGGRLDNLLDVRLRWGAAVFLAVVVRYGTELAVRSGIPAAEALRLPLFTAGFGLLFLALWLNRERPGLLVAAAGVLANGVAVVVNGGWMPVWVPSLQIAGLSARDLVPGFHRALPEELDLGFLLRAGPLGDVLPIPVPVFTNVASVGDVFLSAGLGWFVFATLLPVARESAGAPETRPAARPTAPVVGIPRASATTVAPETGLLRATAQAAFLDRPVFLGDVAARPALPAGGSARRPELEVALAPGIVRLGRHPYVRLALDARFSAFWLGQTISLFGDRLHQVALAVLVYGESGSPLLTGLVFLAATLPNLLLGPIAGTFVDRWDQKRVMVASDLLRAGLVLLLPVAAMQQLVLVFPLVFAVTSVSIFFRPAKAAVVPRIVRREDLLAANSATWTSETLADLIGYPLAGLFVGLLGSAITLAFWADAATYLVSAVLLVGLAIPPVARETGAAASRVGGAVSAFLGELRDGWRFLRGQPALFQNTLISAVAQMSIGANIALLIVYARDALDGSVIPYPGNYAALETAIGLGNLLGGIAVGAVGARLRKGWLIVGGFVAMGLSSVMLGLTGNVLIAIVAAIGIGVANLVYVIPTQTLFAERTPQELMGRVVAFRSSLVYGALTGAMALSGVLAEAVQVGLVIAAFGALTAASGLVAAALPAIRGS